MPARSRPIASPEAWPLLDLVDEALRPKLAAARQRLFVLGICGAQGSGKSTLAAALAERTGEAGVAAATLSLDDLYLTRAERERLACDIHPLFRTRGVPGTHDVELGLRIIEELGRGGEVALPRFDKGSDDRLPVGQWPFAPAGTRLLILEGWCVGARAQDDEDLSDPVNSLERQEDPDAVWRRYANRALAADYQRMFGRIDLLLLLAAPSWQVVQGWRNEQEQELRGREGAGAMSDEEVARFVQHYQRLTLHILDEMPDRADLTVYLDDGRRLSRVRQG